MVLNLRLYIVLPPEVKLEKWKINKNVLEWACNSTVVLLHVKVNGITKVDDRNLPASCTQEARGVTLVYEDHGAVLLSQVTYPR